VLLAIALPAAWEDRKFFALSHLCKILAIVFLAYGNTMSDRWSQLSTEGVAAMSDSLFFEASRLSATPLME
jgi:hypothetical protein